MKNFIKYPFVAAIAALFGLATVSCSMEQPFAEEEGTLRMNLVINSDVTRAQLSDDDLAEKCVVYISGDKGLIRKYEGLSSLPQQETLRTGRYVAEAWTGDSVPASFDKRFFRGYQPFQINPGVNAVELRCPIVNVVTSVNPEGVNAELIKDFNIKVESSNGSLDFTPDNYRDAKGYFMMPYGADGVRESELKVTVTGRNLENKPFTKVQTIKNVKSAFEYVINFTYNPEDNDPAGGGYITITIDERETLIRDTVAIFAAPSIEGVDFDITHQIVGEPGQFSGDKVVKIIAFREISSFTVECVDMESLNLPAQQIDLKNCDDAMVARLNSAGISWDKQVTDVEGYDGVTRQLSYLYFSEQYLNSLPARNTEYIIRLTATDGDGKHRSQDLRIAVGEEAVVIEDPIVVDDLSLEDDKLAVGARSATLSATIVDDNVSDVSIRYRESGSSAWTTVPLSLSRAAGKKCSVTVSGLKPGTRYEYQALCGEFVSQSMYFNTESIFTIPNASMEEWSTYSASTMLGTRNVTLPWSVGDKSASFWGSGNEGSATANKTVLDKSGDMKASGSYSARLASTSAVGVIAAGNIFIGSYVRTDGTNGVLSLGREFNGSHPTKLRVHANYRPGGNVTVKKGNEGYVEITSGGTDQGQIYIALTTAPIEIRTDPSNRKLFPSSATNEDGKPSEDYDKVIAYGQVTWKEAFGPDGALQEVDIPFVYNDRARTTAPVYLVLVASASKFGDFFCGSSSSVMYLDDFELIYE